MELVIKTRPRDKINWMKAMTGKNKIYGLNPIPLKIKKIRIIRLEIIKFVNPLATTEIGNTSRGKYTFLIMFALLMTVVVPNDITVVKKFQGIMATIRKIT